MKWLSELWGSADRWTRLALIAAVVAVAALLLWFVGGEGVGWLGTWLGSN